MMKTYKIIISITAFIFYFANVSTARSCCWSSGYDFDEFGYESDSEPNYNSKRLVEYPPSLKNYTVDVKQYDNCKTTSCHLIESRSVYKKFGAIIGTDDRELVANVEDKLWKPHGFLGMGFPNNKNYRGSGTVIHPHHVLTAAHNIYGIKKGGWATSITFTPARNGTHFPYGQAQVTQIFVAPEWIHNEDPKYDFALLVLDRDIGYQTGWYGLMAPNKTFLSTLEINVTGYPGDKGGHQMYTMSGKPTSIFSERFNYTIDTNKGQSGGSVWATLNDNGRYCCGVHTNGVPDVKNTATRISNTKFDLLVNLMNHS